MGKALGKELREARKVVRGWADALRPIAQKNACPENFSNPSNREKGYEETFSDDGRRIVFGNLGSFQLVAHHSGGKFLGEGKPINSGFIYSRSVRLYDNKTEKSLNEGLAARLLVPVLDWADFVGLGAMPLVDLRSEAREPGIYIRGELPTERFSDYLALVQQVEKHLDWNLALAEKNMERPFAYALVSAPTDRQDLTIYRQVQGIGSLKDAHFVVVSRKEMPEEYLKTAYLRNENRPSKSDVIGINGKILTVDEFVTSRK